MDQNPYQAPSMAEYATRSAGSSDGRRGFSDPKWLLFSFDGRAYRSQYWAGVAVMAAIYMAIFALIALVVPMQSMGPEDEQGPGGLLMVGLVVLYLAILWIGLALSVKRWHDRGKSGWMWLISFVPLIGPIWHFVEVGCLRGTEGTNQYGDDPTPR